MKTEFKNRLVAITLSMMMTAVPVWGTAHAADEAIGDQTGRPVAESCEDNDKIAEYNKKVDDYNEDEEMIHVATLEAEAAPAREVLEAEETVMGRMENLEIPMAGTAANESLVHLNLVMVILTAIASALLLAGCYGSIRREDARRQK